MRQGAQARTPSSVCDDGPFLQRIALHSLISERRISTFSPLENAARSNCSLPFVQFTPSMATFSAFPQIVSDVLSHSWRKKKYFSLIPVLQPGRRIVSLS